MTIAIQSVYVADMHAPLTGLNLHKLSVPHLPQIVDLQALVHGSLPQHQKSFIVVKTPETYSQLLTDPNGGVGIFTAENRLVAQAFMKIGQGNNLAGLVDTPVTRLLAKTCGRFAVLQNILVNPAYRGQHLMRHMLDALEHMAQGSGIDTLLTEVAATNERSKGGFRNDGYKLAQTTDDIDGTKLVFLQKKLTARSFSPGHS